MIKDIIIKFARFDRIQRLCVTYIIISLYIRYYNDTSLLRHTKVHYKQLLQDAYWLEIIIKMGIPLKIYKKINTFFRKKTKSNLFTAPSQEGHVRSAPSKVKSSLFLKMKNSVGNDIVR